MKKIVLIAMSILTLFACGGVGRNGLLQNDGKFSRADTLIREALGTRDYQRALALADSLEQTGDFSSVRADNYRGDAYSSLGRRAESKECYRRATANKKPAAHDLWCYQEAGNSLAKRLYLDADFDVSLTKIGSTADKQFYAGSTLNGNNAKLKVTKSGGGYQIQFGAMKYTVDSTTSTTTYNGTAFSFAGAVKKGLILQ